MTDEEAARELAISQHPNWGRAMKYGVRQGEWDQHAYVTEALQSLLRDRKEAEGD